jgi:hypothetical protein
VLAKANKIVFLSVIICVKPIQFTKPKNHEKISFILSILLCSTAAFAQEKSDSFEAYEKMLFPSTSGTLRHRDNYERIVSEYVSLEVGVGLPSIGIGAKIFFSKIQEQKMMFNTD